ncbi:DNA polymerase III subunits gamma and tau [Prevotella denticola DNF00960]|uniref:DNA polymerase III subunit gamma/tau n=1 Tax=Prevotella denticola TaxID=28129 RepID=UPI00050DAC11|nr:DNA polymerase III subunit gamma/tau [Prevotella denticola]KGF39268.1 DNA polymerase III subunits gamma and tau [Prevotella denticola DNF00960]
MDEYIVSARKYRPMSFDSVVGQQALTTTLKNAVKSGKLAHAYLFCGPRGVGKTTCARIFAKAINCEHPTADGEACNECESCKAFAEGRSYNIFELDAASNNSVENIKSLMEQTRIPPQVGRYKVFIIDEVHMLSTAAFNAFLKTLEEPPAHVIFILATTEKHKILPTILSRCQIYDFERMTVPNIISHLKNVAEKENIQYEEEALAIIAEKADGGMRDALSIFDQAASFSQGNITYQKVIEDLNVLDADNYFNIVSLALENKVSEIMVLLNDVLNKGFDGGHLVNGLASHVRNVLMAKDAQTLPLLEVSQQQRQRYQEQAQKCPTRFLYNALQIMNRCDVEYRQSSNKRLLVELTLIQVAQLTQKDDDVPASGRSPKRLKSLFKNLILKAQQKPAPQVVGSLKHNDETYRSDDRKAVANPSQALPSASSTPVSRPAAKVMSGLPKSINLGALSMSFDNLLKSDKKKTQEDEPEITNKDENEAFTQQELVVRWRAMCTRMPDKMQALAQRMKNITPTITEFPNIQVLAENNIQLNEMLPIRSRIRATLAKDLHNGQIGLTIRLARQEEIKPMLTPREELDKLMRNNSPVKKLVEALGLDLA